MALTVEMVKALIFRQMGPTIRRVNLMVSRGVIRRVADGARAQLVQLSLLGDNAGDEEVADEVEHVQPFGVSFVPPAGSEVVAISVGGNRDHVLAIGASSRAHRPTERDEGEGGLYTMSGWTVLCDAAGNVYIGGDEIRATFKVALASKVEAELGKIGTEIGKIKTTLGSLSGGATTAATFTTSYTGSYSASAVGSDNVFVTQKAPEVSAGGGM